MSWSFSAALVHELVQAQKSPAPGQQLTFVPQGDHGRELAVMLELTDGGLFHLRLIVAAGRTDSPETYEASLLLNNRRIRGVGFSKIERKKFFKTHIPKGWHENVQDYLLPITDDGHNRHDPLPDFSATDLQDFLRKVCTRWNTRLDFDQDLW